MDPYTLGLWLAAALFAIGLFGMMARRNVLFVLMSLELMLNAGVLAFVVAGARWGEADGQVVAVFAFAVAAAEAAVALAIVLQLRWTVGDLDPDAARRMRG